MELLLIIAIILISIVLFFMFGSNSSTIIRTSPKKKEQIKDDYLAQLKKILNNCSTKEEKIAQKKIFMQKVNSELSRNIYFDETEAKELLKKLSVA